MPAITSTGLGSGLKINDIVEAIIDAEKVPVKSKIDSDAALATAQISAFGSINSALSTFKDSYKYLSKTSTFSAVSISSSDESVLTAKAGVGAQTGVFNIEVKEKAQAQTLASASFTSPNDQLGTTGELKIRFGSYDAAGTTFSVNPDATIQIIPIDATNNTLSTFRDSINADEKNGMSATIINDGSGYRLVLSSENTGENYAMEIVATIDDADNDTSDNLAGLSRLVYNATDKNMTETVEAKNAEIVMNGITITRDSNEIDSVITGVTINLLDTKPGENIRLNINSDTSTVESEIKAFVENYNTLITQLNEFTKVDSSNGEKGVLVGDATIRSIENQLRGILNNRLDHLPGSIKSFANLGIFTNRSDGTLEINETNSALPKFSDVLKNNITDVADFFTATGTATDGQINFISSNSATKPGTYDVEVTNLATKGVLTGLTVNKFEINSANENDTFRVRIDGTESNEIVLENKTYDTMADLIAEIQSKINSDAKLLGKGIAVTVVDDGGKLKIESNKYGATSFVAFTEVDTNFLADLGVKVDQGTQGQNVIGKIDGVDAFGDGQFLLSENGNSTGIKIEITGGALGNRGSISFSEGTTVLLNALLISMIDNQISNSSGDVNSSSVDNAPPSTLLDSKTDSLYKKLEQLDRQDEDLKMRMEKYEARLYKQFNAMDSAVASLNATLNGLTSMLDQLPGYTRDK
ncbi:MAG: flagellar filament capping protein FliD [Alteromonadaceae bacterium]|nr:flagellar filament capping protein FliD [Alteromonadaceae bacterium]